MWLYEYNSDRKQCAPEEKKVKYNGKLEVQKSALFWICKILDNGEWGVCMSER